MKGDVGISLGYEVGTARSIAIPFGHTVVSGQTQLSGKTTTLEALVSRSGRRAVAFRTKRGEGGFLDGNVLSPYFSERADWQFVEAILESTMRQKMRFERSWIMRASKGASTLADVQRNVKRLMEESKRGMDRDIFMMLGAYLDIVVPVLAKLPKAARQKLARGANVVDLVGLPETAQALVIASWLDRIHHEEDDVVAVVPEAWKFVPQGRNSPVRMAAVGLVREGAALGNLLWLDSQDLAGTEKEILRGASVWLLGVQRETNEVKRTLAHIPAGVKKPRPEDITSLERGQFWTCWPGNAVKVYVQPAWMTSEVAKRVALGEPVPSGPSVPRPTIWKREVVASSHVDVDVDVDGDIEAGLRAVKEIEATKEDEMNPKQEAKLDKVIELLSRTAASPPPAPANHASSKRGKPASSSADVETLAFPVDEEGLYQRFKARLMDEAPGLLRVLVHRPELEVVVESQVVEVDGKTTRGKVAKLVAEGFFDEHRTGYMLFKELGRVGAKVGQSTAYAEVDVLAGLGILTKEKGGYKVAPGAKVRLVER